MKEKGEVPERLSLLEKIQGYIYGIMVVLAWALLIFSSLVLLIYFFSFVINGEFFNKDFIQLCIYVVVGTFLFIFVYDEHWKRKMLRKKNDKDNRKRS